jgi:hypothetical protein
MGQKTCQYTSRLAENQARTWILEQKKFVEDLAFKNNKDCGHTRALQAPIVDVVAGWSQIRNKVHTIWYTELRSDPAKGRMCDKRVNETVVRMGKPVPPSIHIGSSEAHVDASFGWRSGCEWRHQNDFSGAGIGGARPCA